MANAAIVIDNNADNGSVIASSQALTMPSSNLLTPHPSERWRSSSSTAFFVLDKANASATVTINNQNGLTTGTALTAIDLSAAIVRGTMVTKIGMYQTTAKTVTLKIAKQNSAGNYDIVVSQSFAHPGGGWADLTLSSAYIVPGSGNYYLAGWSSGTSDETSVVGAYVLTTDVTGTGQIFTESSTAGTWALRYTGISASDTVGLFGLTCNIGSTIRLRLSSIDATGAAGDIYDSGILTSGTASFDATYDSFVYRLPAPAAWRYIRFDIVDPVAALLPATNYVEAGCILDGLAESFTYNFSHGGSFQHIDRSRISPTSSGMTLTWNDNTFRRIDLTFEWVTALQRYGVIERLDRVKGKTSNVLLMTDTASTNLPRDSIYGLVTDQTPITFGPVFDLFGKQLRIDERI